MRSMQRSECLLAYRPLLPGRNIQQQRFVMSRFEIGNRVRVVGFIAEHYFGVTAVIVSMSQHPEGLDHLNRYQVCLSNGNDDTFYEFQLTAASDSGGESVADRLAAS